MKGCVLSSTDFCPERNPAVNEMVFFYVHNLETKRRQAHTGIIAREFDKEHWIINGLPICKEQVLFVITVKAHLRFRAMTNPLAM